MSAPALSTATSIKCIKANLDYYATVQGQRLRLLLNDDRDHVLIFVVDTDRPSRLGGWRVERFGGVLSPDSIRAFFRSPEPKAA